MTEERLPPTPSEFIDAVHDWLLHWWDAPHEKSKPADWAMVGLTIGVAVAAFVSAFIIQGQLEEARTQTRLSVRPFVGLDDEGGDAIQNSVLHIDENGNAYMQYVIRGKNFSIAPAMEVFSYANLVVSDDLNAALEQGKEACRDERIGNHIGTVLFQGKNRVFTGFPTTTKVDARRLNLKPGERAMFSVWLTGCIGYRDQFNFLYRTKFRYQMVDSKGSVVSWIGPPEGAIDVTGKFIATGGEIDAGEIPKFK